MCWSCNKKGIIPSNPPKIKSVTSDVTNTKPEAIVVFKATLAAGSGSVSTWSWSIIGGVIQGDSTGSTINVKVNLDATVVNATAIATNADGNDTKTSVDVTVEVPPPVKEYTPNYKEDESLTMKGTEGYSVPKGTEVKLTFTADNLGADNMIMLDGISGSPACYVKVSSNTGSNQSKIAWQYDAWDDVTLNGEVIANGEAIPEVSKEYVMSLTAKKDLIINTVGSNRSGTSEHFIGSLIAVAADVFNFPSIIKATSLPTTDEVPETISGGFGKLSGTQPLWKEYVKADSGIVKRLPTWELQPKRQSVVSGSTVTLSSIPTNSVSTQWYFGKTSKDDGVPLKGETGNDLTIKAFDPATQTGYYYNKATNLVGTNDTNHVKLDEAVKVGVRKPRRPRKALAE